MTAPDTNEPACPSMEVAGPPAPAARPADDATGRAEHGEGEGTRGPGSDGSPPSPPSGSVAEDERLEGAATNEAKVPRRKTFLVLFGVSVLLVLLGLGLWLSFQPVPDQLQGMTDARETRITSKVTGRIAAFKVEEGQAVDAGQLLYTLDSPEVAARERQALGALRSAQATQEKAYNGPRIEDVVAARAQWQRAQASADLAQVTFGRLDRLYVQGVTTGQRRDEARANSVAATEAAVAARSQYDAARVGTRYEDKRAASGQVEQARGAVAEVSASKVETKVFAPFAGEVGRRLAQPGELVPQGYPVFMLTEVSRPWVTINVREDRLNGLAPGTEIVGTVPALGGRSARFRVYYVAPAGEFATWRATRQSSGFDIKSFEIRVRPVAPVPGLRPGATVLFAWPK